MTNPKRSSPPPLPPADEARLAPAAAELAESIAQADRATVEAADLARHLKEADIRPLAVDDTAVRRARVHLRELERRAV